MPAPTSQPTLWHGSHEYDDELTIHSPYTTQALDCFPVAQGDLITFRGEFWVVSGWSPGELLVFVARDRELVEVKAADVGLKWE